MTDVTGLMHYKDLAILLHDRIWMAFQAFIRFIWRAVFNDSLEQILVPFLVYKDLKKKLAKIQVWG